MAKGKHSAALFEVIGKSKGMKPEPQKGALSTPRWWFKGSKAAETASNAPVEPAIPATATPQPASTVAHGPATPAPAPITASPIREQKPERSGRALGPMTALRPITPPATQPADTSHTPHAPAYSKPAASPAVPVSTTPPVTDTYPVDLHSTDKKVLVDPDRQEIRMRVSYTSAIIVAFAVVVTVGLAVIAGKQWGGGWGTADLQSSTADLMGGPANPTALDATPGQGASGTVDNDPAGLIRDAGLAAVPKTPQTADGKAQPASSQTNPGTLAPTPVTPAARVPRVVGINYFIIQSYPEQADAREVVELLAKNGIATTIERGLAGYPKWHIVVSAEGFTSLRAPEAESLRKRIDQISADQARADKKWKTLTPQGYRWR